MQKKNNQKKPVELVRKPIVEGSWHGKDAWKLARKCFLYVIVITLIYLFSGMLFSFENVALRALVCGTTVMMVGYYLYVCGAAQGQTDAAFGEIAYNRRAEGKNVPADEAARSFHPLKGYFAVLVGAAPFVLFAIVFACMTELGRYQLGVLPTWTTSLSTQTEFADGLRYYQNQPGMGAVDVMRVIDRSMVMPFINVASLFGNEALLAVERLSPLLLLIAPLGYAFGYAGGLNLRARINTGIKEGDARKKRKERKARKQRQRSKTPERLI